MEYNFVILPEKENCVWWLRYISKKKKENNIDF